MTWTLLPSMAFGTPFSVQPDGKLIYITPDRKLLCPHGNCSSTISCWMASERRANLAGSTPPPRGGLRGRGLVACDCQTTVGLHASTDHLQLPHAPESLFEFLVDEKVEMLSLKGRSACRLPHMSGPTFLTACGKLQCQHGRVRQTLRKKSKCGCVLPALPKRTRLYNPKQRRRVNYLMAGPPAVHQTTRVT